MIKLIGAFFRLVRWPNLVFIALTQLLFYYCFIYSRISSAETGAVLLYPALFCLLVAASVLIAAGGYIINDYFDLNIDKINKPAKLIVERIIRRRWTIVWHLFLTSIGVALSFYTGYKIHNWLLGVINLFSAILLWAYSTTFKKELMIGNVIISLLTAWVVLVLYFCEWRFSWIFTNPSFAYKLYITQLFKVAVLYASFAFLLSMIREVVKDIEDIRGDEKHGCRTIPIVWGIQASKIFIATLMVVLIAALCIIQVYTLQLHWWWSAVYCILLVIVPLLAIMRKIYKATQQHDYHACSTAIKLVMLSGILSMLFFKMYS